MLIMTTISLNKNSHLANIMIGYSSTRIIMSLFNNKLKMSKAIIIRKRKYHRLKRLPIKSISLSPKRRKI